VFYSSFQHHLTAQGIHLSLLGGSHRIYYLTEKLCSIITYLPVQSVKISHILLHRFLAEGGCAGGEIALLQSAEGFQQREPLVSELINIVYLLSGRADIHVDLRGIQNIQHINGNNCYKISIVSQLREIIITEILVSFDLPHWKYGHKIIDHSSGTGMILSNFSDARHPKENNRHLFSEYSGKSVFLIHETTKFPFTFARMKL